MKINKSFKTVAPLPAVFEISQNEFCRGEFDVGMRASHCVPWESEKQSDLIFSRLTIKGCLKKRFYLSLNPTECLIRAREALKTLTPCKKKYAQYCLAVSKPGRFHVEVVEKHLASDHQVIIGYYNFNGKGATLEREVEGCWWWDYLHFKDIPKEVEKTEDDLRQLISEEFALDIWRNPQGAGLEEVMLYMYPASDIFKGYNTNLNKAVNARVSMEIGFMSTYTQEAAYYLKTLGLGGRLFEVLSYIKVRYGLSDRDWEILVSHKPYKIFESWRKTLRVRSLVNIIRRLANLPTVVCKMDCSSHYEYAIVLMTRIGLEKYVPSETIDEGMQELAEIEEDIMVERLLMKNSELLNFECQDNLETLLQEPADPEQDFLDLTNPRLVLDVESFIGSIESPAEDFSETYTEEDKVLELKQLVLKRLGNPGKKQINTVNKASSVLEVKELFYSRYKSITKPKIESLQGDLEWFEIYSKPTTETKIHFENAKREKVRRIANPLDVKKEFLHKNLFKPLKFSDCKDLVLRITNCNHLRFLKFTKYNPKNPSWKNLRDMYEEIEEVKIRYEPYITKITELTLKKKILIDKYKEDLTFPYRFSDFILRRATQRKQYVKRGTSLFLSQSGGIEVLENIFGGRRTLQRSKVNGFFIPNLIEERGERVNFVRSLDASPRKPRLRIRKDKLSLKKNIKANRRHRHNDNERAFPA